MIGFRFSITEHEITTTITKVQTTKNTDGYASLFPLPHNPKASNEPKQTCPRQPTAAERVGFHELPNCQRSKCRRMGFSPFSTKACTGEWALARSQQKRPIVNRYLPSYMTQAHADHPAFTSTTYDIKLQLTLTAVNRKTEAFYKP